MIRVFDDPMLQEVCTPIENKEELVILKTLGKVLSATNNGIGLAAPQVGITKKAIAIRPDIKKREIKFLINPEIVEVIGKEVEVREGCLSYPGAWCNVKRNNAVIVEFLNEDMRKIRDSFVDMEAVTVQHEIDHISDPPKCYVGDYWRENIKGKQDG